MTLAVVFDSVGFGEWVVLLAVVLIVVGPKRLPATARKIGSYYSKFRRAAETFKRQLLDMDSEFEQTVRDVTAQPEDAFKIEDDDSSQESMSPGRRMYYDSGYDGNFDYAGGDENGAHAEELPAKEA